MTLLTRGGTGKTFHDTKKKNLEKEKSTQILTGFGNPVKNTLIFSTNIGLTLRKSDGNVVWQNRNITKADTVKLICAEKT